MKLQFRSHFKSVNSFDEMEINNFSIFTGKNGSGKTHLLQAIRQGGVLADDINPNQILYLNYLDFAHNFQTITTTENSVKVQAWNRLKNRNGNDIIFQLNNSENIINAHKDFIEELASRKNKPIFDLTLADLEENEQIFNILEQYKQHITLVFDQPNYVGDELAYSLYDSVYCKSNKFISTLSQKEFMSLYQKSAVGGKKILSDLSYVFLDYYKSIKRNQLSRIEGKSSLSDEEFVHKYGEAPWIMVGDILKTFDIGFEINDPIKEQLDPWDGTFQIKFTNTRRGNIEVPFNDLSSGEQILITLVNAIFTSNLRGNPPKLLLLDEVDGPINPSIIKNFISYIENSFVKKGMKVIIASHSPSTVAFAPESAIYAVDTSADIPIKNVTLNKGIEILSEGFITLEQGIRITDGITAGNISIITEGNNIAYINKLLDLYAVKNVEVVGNLENISGKTQLRTLFDFFSKIPHTKKIIFVWDCDAAQYHSLKEVNNTIPFIFSSNTSNTIAIKGIENLFDESLFNDFKKTIIMSNGSQKIEFDESRKKDFEKFVISRNNKDDFKNFESLTQKLKQLNDE